MQVRNSLAITILAGLLGFGLQAADSVRFAIGEWEPYTGQELEANGLAAEIVSAACAAAAIKAHFEFSPWKRAEASVEGGSSFATFPYQASRERAGKFGFSDPICKSSNGILFHKGNSRTAHFVYSRPEDLKGLKVGGLLGSDVINLPIKEAGGLLEEVQSVDQNITKLALDRIDLVIDDRPVLFQAVKKASGADPAKLGTFAFADKGFGATTEYRLMVSRKYPQAGPLLARFNAGLKKITTSGLYRKILKKYGL